MNFQAKLNYMSCLISISIIEIEINAHNSHFSQQVLSKIEVGQKAGFQFNWNFIGYCL